MRIDLVGTTADFRGFGPPPSLPINHLLCENPQTAGRIGEDGLACCRHEQERWALSLICPARLCRDLRRGRTPFRDIGYEKPKSDKHVDVGCKGPMLLDHSFSEPIRRTRTFIQVAVNGPSLVI